MADATENTNQTTQASDPLSAYKAEHGGKGPKATRGEKLFNALDYYGLGWVANAIVSVYAADAAKHTYAQPTQTKLTQWFGNRWPFNKTESQWTTGELRQANALHESLTKNHFPEIDAEIKNAGKSIKDFLEKVGTPSESVLGALKEEGILTAETTETLAKEFEHLAEARKATARSGSLVSFAMLNIGGWLMLAPMKLLEDRKEPIVEKFDEMLGSKEGSEARKLAVEARHEKLKHEHKQTWTSELISRAVSTPLILGLYYNTMAKENMISKTGAPLLKEFEGSDIYAEKFAEGATKMMGEERAAAAEAHLGKSPQQTLERLQKEGGAEDFTIHSGEERLKNIFSFTFLEVTYSAVMATLVFISSRIFGPIFGKKSEYEPAQTSSHAPARESDWDSAVQNEKKPVEPQHEQAVVNGMTIDVPDTVVQDAHAPEPVIDPGEKKKKEYPAYQSHAERALHVDDSGRELHS